jgi:hypothetical protein
MSTMSKINGSCDNCCVNVKGAVSADAKFGGQIEIDSEPVYDFNFDVEYDSGKVKKECQKAADEALINKYKDELIDSLKKQAKEWVNNCLNAQPAPCNQIVYPDPNTGTIIKNPAYKPYPSTVLDFKDFDDTLCFNNCDGECTAE